MLKTSHLAQAVTEFATRFDNVEDLAQSVHTSATLLGNVKGLAQTVTEFTTRFGNVEDLAQSVHTSATLLGNVKGLVERGRICLVVG